MLMDLLARTDSGRDEWSLNGLTRTIDAQSDLLYQLNRLQKPELVEIRQRLNLLGLSSLRKQELATALVEPIVSNTPSQIGLLDDMGYDLINQLVKAKGILSGAENIPLEVLVHLRSAGLAFTGRMDDSSGLALVMPQDMVVRCRSLVDSEEVKAQIRRNQRVLWAARGLLSYYGFLSIKQLQLMLAEIGLNLSQEYLGELLYGIGEAAAYLSIKDDLVCDTRLLKVEAVKEVQQGIPDLGFYPLTLEKAIEIGTQQYLDWTVEHVALFEYLQEECEMDDDDASQAMDYFLFACNNFLPASIVLSELSDMGAEIESYPQAAQVMSLIAKAWRHTRLWAYRGHTLAEIESRQNRRALRVIGGTSTIKKRPE